MSSDIVNGNKKFEEALHLLNEAAKEKKEDVVKLLSEKYSHIKDALDEGRDKAAEVFEDVDKTVRKNPWPYIGGVAIGALLFGFILGNQKK